MHAHAYASIFRFKDVTLFIEPPILCWNEVLLRMPEHVQFKRYSASEVQDFRDIIVRTPAKAVQNVSRPGDDIV